MEIVLVRHGVRSDKRCEHLSERGRHQADEVARALEARGSLPDTLLTSASLHAWETADRVGRQPGYAIAPVVLEALTPGRGPGTIQDVAEQAEEQGLDLRMRR